MPKGSLPNGYSFVPKGNVYITSNCRKATQESGRTVNIVVDAKNQQIGIGVPTEIYVVVQFKERDTRAARATNVLKKDEGIAKAFQKEIVNIFPQIPSKALDNVVKIALEKGKGKVGRTGKLDVKRKVHLAVWAHIRHCETDYDKLLRSGVAREEARLQVEEKIKEVRKAWGGDSQKKHGKPGKSPKSAAGPNFKSAQATKGAKKDSPGLPKKTAKTSTSTTTTTKALSPRTSKIVRLFTNERNAAVRSAMRAHRQKSTLESLETDVTKATKQQKPAPKNSSPKVIATAASFREKRAPKPTSTQPVAPSPPRAKTRWANPAMPDLDHEHRAQILRLITRIDRIEHAHRIGRTRDRQRQATRIRTVASLYNQINGILADASVQAIAEYSAARRDLARRLGRKVPAPEESRSPHIC